MTGLAEAILLLEKTKQRNQQRVERVFFFMIYLTGIRRQTLRSFPESRRCSSERPDRARDPAGRAGRIGQVYIAFGARLQIGQLLASRLPAQEACISWPTEGIGGRRFLKFFLRDFRLRFVDTV